MALAWRNLPKAFYLETSLRSLQMCPSLSCEWKPGDMGRQRVEKGEKPELWSLLLELKPLELGDDLGF